jgi:maltose/moltooligosaccharide transporter
METHQKPFLPISQIISMNVGFLGIQYSFGLQQTAINPLYSFLGANPDELPLLNLAGPMTGLIIQPIIGAISDKTWIPKLGRRKPFFLIGAIFCSLCLFIFPFSSSLWMAAGLLWILDAANNTTMEPYRAFIADKLNPKQQATGFLIQSFFTGCGITLANFSLYFFQKTMTGNTSSLDNKSIPYWVFGSFFIGAIISITTVLFSMYKTQEIPPTDEELKLLKAEKLNIFTPFKDIADSISKMPKIMWHLFFVYLFQWYALFCYWQYISLDVSSTIFANANSDKAVYEQAVGWTGIMNGF